MWVEVRKAPNLILAEMWKLLLESEGVPTRILPVQDGNPEAGISGTGVSPVRDGNPTGSAGVPPAGVDMKEFVPYKIMVPHFRVHVYEEILRKL